jgi:hypothetical protein
MKKTRQLIYFGVILTESRLSGLPAETDPAQEGSVKLKFMDGA